MSTPPSSCKAMTEISRCRRGSQGVGDFRRMLEDMQRRCRFTSLRGSLAHAGDDSRSRAGKQSTWRSRLVTTRARDSSRSRARNTEASTSSSAPRHGRVRHSRTSTSGFRRYYRTPYLARAWYANTRTGNRALQTEGCAGAGDLRLRALAGEPRANGTPSRDNIIH